MTDLAASCADLARWLPIAAALIAQPDTDGTTAIGPGSAMKTIEFTGRPRRPCDRPRGVATPAERCSMDDATHEAWRPVVGYEGLYEVSDLGRVRSLPRETENGRRGRAVRKGRILSQHVHRSYLMVCLSRSGKSSTISVHRLVLTAFVGPRPPGQETRHGPGGAFDNRLANLCYGTPVENMADQVRDGTRSHFSQPSERHGRAKLSWAAVAECRARGGSGETVASLARQYQVDESTMRAVLAHKTWRQP